MELTDTFFNTSTVPFYKREAISESINSLHLSYIKVNRVLPLRSSTFPFRHTTTSENISEQSVQVLLRMNSTFIRQATVRGHMQIIFPEWLEKFQTWEETTIMSLGFCIWFLQFKSNSSGRLLQVQNYTVVLILNLLVLICVSLLD